MRYVLGFMCVLALGLPLMVGCSDENGEGGSGGTAGTGGMAGEGGTGGIAGQVFPCTEQGINDAIAEGGGPHTFACDGPQTVVTKAEIVIDNDVILNGEGKLTVDGGGPHADPLDNHRIFSVTPDVEVELLGLTITGGWHWGNLGGGGVANEGTLIIRRCIIAENVEELNIDSSVGGGGGVWNGGQMTITDSAIVDNSTDHSVGGGISNDSSGTLALMNSTVASNSAFADGGGGMGGGIVNDGQMTIVNSTVSGNEAHGLFDASGAGILNYGRLSLLNSTIAGNRADFGDALAIGWTGAARPDPYVEIASTLIDGECTTDADGVESNATLIFHGYNIESPGDACGFDPDGNDWVNVTTEQLNLGPLTDNGGPTLTHKPGDGGFGEGSAAIDRIPEADCTMDTDQRGEPRPVAILGAEPRCDVGAFEVQP